MAFVTRWIRAIVAGLTALVSCTLGFAYFAKPGSRPVSPGDGRRPGVAAARAQVPRAVVDQTEYDFGVMDPRTRGEHEFLVKNGGDAPLQLKEGSTTCKCTVAELPGAAVAPGEVGRVRLRCNLQRLSAAGVGESPETRQGDWLRAPAAGLVLEAAIDKDVLRRQEAGIVDSGRDGPLPRVEVDVRAVQLARPSLSDPRDVSALLARAGVQLRPVRAWPLSTSPVHHADRSRIEIPVHPCLPEEPLEVDRRFDRPGAAVSVRRRPLDKRAAPPRLAPPIRAVRRDRRPTGRQRQHHRKTQLDSHPFTSGQESAGSTTRLFCTMAARFTIAQPTEAAGGVALAVPVLGGASMPPSGLSSGIS
jgi:hypothetical protein